MWIIVFNSCGNDSVCHVDGRKSLSSVHTEALNHYNKMVKFKGCFSKEYGIGKNCQYSQVNERKFKIH